MYIEQLYTNCLAEAAYYIESNGEAAIIDPLRETEPYIRKAAERGAKIKYILETHFHADFVSGHIDLAKKTGAQIVYGPTAEANFEFHRAGDGEELSLGNIKLKMLHTPGHTLESATYLLLDENDKEHAIFTGDTLFIGDVGRPDLAVKSDLSKEDLAGKLYDSLHNKIMPLPDETIIYPGHGAGSACGKNISDKKSEKLGTEKKTNYALQDMTKEAFINKVTEGLGLVPPPQYFPKDALINKQGYESIDKVMENGNQPLSLETFQQKRENGALVLDTRDQKDYREGSIPGSLNIGLDGSFAVWVGTLIEDLNTEIIVVAPEGREEETILRLARVGYDHTTGYLENGFSTWNNAGKEIQSIRSISPADFEKEYEENGGNVIDVRNPGEYDSEHLEGADNKPLTSIENWSKELNAETTYYLHCKSGYRSMTSCSFLKSKGFENVIDIDGGFDEIKKTDIPKTDYVCPSELT